MMDKVAILHTNDLHSHFENWPKIRRFMKLRTKQLEDKGYRVFKVDDGDAIDRSNALTEATSGKANIELMNSVGYDAATIGNNEALTTSHDELAHLYDDANFPVVLDNVIDERTGQLPSWAIPYRDFLLKNNVRVRFMGLTAPYPTYQYMDWNSLPIKSTIERCLTAWKGQYDVLILLSHLGINNDRRIAKAFPKINVIVGGHTHHLLVHGEKVNQTMLTAAEKWGHYVGEITFDVNDDKQVENMKSRVYKTSEMKADVKDAEEIEHLEDRGEGILASQRVADIPHTMTTSLTDDNELVDLGLKAIEKKAGTTAAVLNTGLFLGNLDKGVVDKNELHKLLPHSIHVMKSEFYGYNLWEVVMEMEKNKDFLVRFEQKGMGFRGKYFGRLIYDGIRYDPEKKQLFYHDELVEPDKKYTIALIDHYSFIPFFPAISIVGKNDIFYDETLRDVFGDYLAKKFPLKGE